VARKKRKHSQQVPEDSTYAVGPLEYLKGVDEAIMKEPRPKMMMAWVNNADMDRMRRGIGELYLENMKLKEQLADEKEKEA